MGYLDLISCCRQWPGYFLPWRNEILLGQCHGKRKVKLVIKLWQAILWWLKSVIKERALLHSREHSHFLKAADLQVSVPTSVYTSLLLCFALFLFFCFLRQAGQYRLGCLGAPGLLKLKASLLPQYPECSLPVSGELLYLALKLYNFMCLLPAFTSVHTFFNFPSSQVVQGNRLC